MPSLPVRNSRSCNALAFCAADSNYLAVGLDKVRGDSSLIIWDVNSVMPTLSVKAGPQSIEPDVQMSSARPQPLLPKADFGTRTDPRILQQHAPAEIVSSVSWLPKSTSLLLAGVSHRWLRLFDLRSHTPLMANIASKVHGIATDPFDQHQFGCFGDGVANIWDIRNWTHPLLTFTEKDASADGARARPGDVFSSMEFSSVRRGMLATLERDASHVRFWDSQKVDAHRTPDGMSRDSSYSSRATRLSWANPTNMLPWANTGPMQATPSTTPGDGHKISYNLVLSDTRKSMSLSLFPLFVATHDATLKTAKDFPKALSSFALVPSADPHPLTSNVMVVNREGDLELYAIHDTPTHSPWSPRGELALGIRCSYRIIHGSHAKEPPPEPWDIDIQPSMPNSAAHSVERNAGRESAGRSHTNSPPMFGRGDEDGFPALTLPPARTPTANLAATRPPGSVSLKSLQFEHTAIVKLDGNDSSHSSGSRIKHGHGRHAHTRRTGTIDTMQHNVESDISMIMRRRVIQGYSITSVSCIVHSAVHCSLYLSAFSQLSNCAIQGG